MALAVKIYSSDFDGFFEFGGINLLNVTAGKNVILVNGLFVEDVRNGGEFRVDNVGEKFERRSSFWFIEHFGTHENVGGESFEPKDNLVNNLPRFFISEFFEQNDFGVRFGVAGVKEGIDGLLGLSDRENGRPDGRNIFASLVYFSSQLFHEFSNQSWIVLKIVAAISSNIVSLGVRQSQGHKNR